MAALYKLTISRIESLNKADLPILPQSTTNYTTSTPTQQAPSLSRDLQEVENSSWRTPSLQINVDGAEFILTDSKGRRTGFNASKSQISNDIPNSSYEDSEIIPPNEKASGRTQREVYVGENAGGDYTLRFSKKQGTDIVLSVNGFDANLYQTATEVTVPTGSSIVGYKINFEPGVAVTITPL